MYFLLFGRVALLFRGVYFWICDISTPPYKVCEIFFARIFNRLCKCLLKFVHESHGVFQNDTAFSADHMLLSLIKFIGIALYYDRDIFYYDMKWMKLVPTSLSGVSLTGTGIIFSSQKVYIVLLYIRVLDSVSIAMVSKHSLNWLFLCLVTSYE